MPSIEVMKQRFEEKKVKAEKKRENKEKARIKAAENRKLRAERERCTCIYQEDRKRDKQ